MFLAREDFEDGKLGGAVNQAGIDFYNGWKNKYTAYDFVENMKNKGQIISGIGHKIKSKDNLISQPTLEQVKNKILQQEINDPNLLRCTKNQADKLF